MADIKYLKRLSRDYPHAMAAAAEIVNINAILALPKGTEYFLSDLHGEHEAFVHMLKSASGTIKSKSNCKLLIISLAAPLRSFLTIFSVKSGIPTPAIERATAIKIMVILLGFEDK